MSDDNDDESIPIAIKNDGTHEDYFRNTSSENITNSKSQQNRNGSADYSTKKSETLTSNSGSRGGGQGRGGSRE
jgi:hypothetical protein